MSETSEPSSALIELPGTVIGLAVGVVIGPFVFPIGYPAASTLGCVVGGICGFALARAARSRAERRHDRQLAEAIRHELTSVAHLPETIQVEVDRGRVVLRGEVDAYSQRVQAARALSGIPGIRSVENYIRLRPPAGIANPDEVKQAVEGALRAAAERDALGIQVHVHDSRVILEGKVRSWTEAHDAEEAVWAIPGVQEVENRLLADVDV